MSPRFSEESLRSFYQEEYQRLYCGQGVRCSVNIREQKARAGHLAEYLLQTAEPLDSILEIGCSAGELLSEFERRIPGVRLVGVEPSADRRDWCAAAGLLTLGSLEEVEQDDLGKFQLVAMSHVLEHMADPVSYLRRLREEFLSPGGWLLVEVPNLLGHTSFEIAHLVCFTRKTLIDTLGASGFQLVAFKVHSVPRSYSERRRYLTAIARPDQRGRTPRILPVYWRYVRLLRMRGMSGHSWAAVALKILAKPRLAWEKARALLQ